MTKDPAPIVVLQTVGNREGAQVARLAVRHAGPGGVATRLRGVQEIGKQLLYEPRRFDGAVFAATRSSSSQKGQGIYQQLCFACHGVDGHGMPMDGQPPGTTLAPPLAGSKTVLAPHQSMVSILSARRGRPINGKTYDSIMPAQGDNDDEWIASIVSYVRNSFGNNAPPVTPQEVAAVARRPRTAQLPWTLEELKAVVPQPLPNREQWKVTASDGAEPPRRRWTARNDTRYTTGVRSIPASGIRSSSPRTPSSPG